MASPTKGGAEAHHGRKRPAKYLPHNAKRKKDLELRSGLQGFLITCDGGRERQSCREAIILLERFYEKVKPSSTNSSEKDTRSKAGCCLEDSKEGGDQSLEACSRQLDEDSAQGQKTIARGEEESFSRVNESAVASKGNSVECLLEEEMTELRDESKARFAGLETSCNGIVFIRMSKEDRESTTVPAGPIKIVEAIMHEAANFQKPLTRSCLRFLPVEITCYASADEVKVAAGPFLQHHFPVGQGVQALKFAVVYEARANTNIDRMEIINAVAKLVPEPHSVDLKNPDKTIIVQVVKTICAIGVVNNYKQFAKYNLRQLTSPRQQS